MDHEQNKPQHFHIYSLTKGKPVLRFKNMYVKLSWLIIQLAGKAHSSFLAMTVIFIRCCVGKMAQILLLYVKDTELTSDLAS